MTHWQLPILETDRLYLRPIEAADADSIFMYASDEEVALTTAWYAHKSLDDTMEFINNYVLANYQREVPEPWGITLKENPEMVIGTVGLTVQMYGDHVMRLHYALSRTFWGQGIIPEAGKKVVDYGFETYDCERVWAYCQGEANSAARALQKIGFQEEGRLRHALYSKGEYHDLWSFGILKEDVTEKV